MINLTSHKYWKIISKYVTLVYIHIYTHTHIFSFLIVTSNIALEILAYYYITINFNRLIFVGYYELKLIIVL